MPLSRRLHKRNCSHDLSKSRPALPAKKEAFGDLMQLGDDNKVVSEATWFHPAGPEDESRLANWSLKKGIGIDKRYPDAFVQAIKLVQHGVCLVPALEGGWALRPTKQMSKGEIVMTIDGDRCSAKLDVHGRIGTMWRADFTRSSLGRVSGRRYLFGDASRELWPHVKIAGGHGDPSLVVVRSHDGRDGLQLIATRDLPAWGAQLDLQILKDKVIATGGHRRQAKAVSQLVAAEFMEQEVAQQTVEPPLGLHDSSRCEMPMGNSSVSQATSEATAAVAAPPIDFGESLRLFRAR